MTILPYADAALGAEERVSDLIGRMDLNEKLAQLGAVAFAELITDQRFDEEAALAVIPHGIGQVTRIGATTGLEPEQSAELLNQIQRLVIERTRLGIPVMVHEESVAGYCARGATVFPQALALGCSWDPELVHEVASTIRAAAARGGRPAQPGTGARRRPRPTLGARGRDVRRGSGARRHARYGLCARDAGRRPVPRRPRHRQALPRARAVGGRAQPRPRSGRAEGAAGGLRGALRRGHPRRRTCDGDELLQLRRRSPRERLGGDSDAPPARRARLRRDGRRRLLRRRPADELSPGGRRPFGSCGQGDHGRPRPRASRARLLRRAARAGSEHRQGSHGRGRHRGPACPDGQDSPRPVRVPVRRCRQGTSRLLRPEQRRARHDGQPRGASSCSPTTECCRWAESCRAWR